MLHTKPSIFASTILATAPNFSSFILATAPIFSSLILVIALTSVISFFKDLFQRKMKMFVSPEENKLKAADEIK